jgi:exodeoxyribonuclease V alpha subunit
VDYKNGRETLSVDDLYENFMLNYCVTIHKSQGSQYDNVVYMNSPNCKSVGKKALYTAISRARQKCIIISKEDDLISIQKNTDNKVTLFMEISDKFEL